MSWDYALFRGLTTKQLQVIRHCANYREVVGDQVIFEEGEPAYSLVVVLRGKVQIYRRTLDGDVALAELGEGSVFGEMGLLSDTGQRTASARALEPSLLFEMTNPIELSKKIGDPVATLRLVENLICLLGERLRKKDRKQGIGVQSIVSHAIGYEPNPAKALASIEVSLPRKLFKVFQKDSKLAAGELLCTRGDESDGFYFLHSGTVEVTIPDNGGVSHRELISAPSICGEIGFFTRQPRSADLRAVDDVTYTHFSGKEFDKLKKNEPEGALGVAFAAAQLAVELILAREELRF